MAVPIGPVEAFVAFAVVALASAIQGSIGFGAALLAAPLLLLLHPAFVPGPVLVSNLVLTVLVARREWGSADLVSLKFVVSGRVLGTIAAALLLADLSQTLFDLLFGVVVLLAVALSQRQGGFARSPRNLTIAGTASGLMGTLSSIGGPPVALVYQNSSPAEFRATLGAHLLVGASISLFAVWGVGHFGRTEWLLSALIAPGALAGFWLSRFGLPLVGSQHIRRAVLVLSMLAAIGVLVRAISRELA